jgi:hypothetical protein
MPKLPKLDTLWVNKNKIANLSVFIDKLVERAPQLKYLSMLNNDACPNYFNGGTPKQYNDYRLYVINRLRNLKNLDNVEVTEQERQEAYKIYGQLALTKTGDESKRKEKEEEEKQRKLEMSKKRKEREERKKRSLKRKDEEQRRKLEEKKKASLLRSRASYETKSVAPVTIDTSQLSSNSTAPILDLPNLEFLAVTGKTDSKPELLVPPFPSRTSSSTSISSSDQFEEIPLNQSTHGPNDGSFSSLFSRLKTKSSDSDDDDLLFSTESESEWSTSDDLDRTAIPHDLPAVDSAPPVHAEDDWSSEDD